MNARNIGIIALLAVTLVAGLWFFLKGSGEEFALDRIERAIAEQGGTVESIIIDGAQGMLEIRGLSLPQVQFHETDEPLDLLEIDRLHATGLTRHALSDLASISAPRHLFDTFTLDGVRLVEDGQRITVQHVALSDAQVVPVGGALAEVERTTREQQSAFSLLMLQMGEVVVEGFASPREGVTGAEIERVVLTDYASGRFESLSASGLRLWDNGQVGTVGDSILLEMDAVEFAGVDATRPLADLVHGRVVTFDRQSQIPTFASLTVRGVEAQDEAGTAIEISRLHVANASYDGALATDTSVSLDAFQFPLDAEEVESSQVNTLRRLGYDDLVIDFEYRTQFDVASGHADISTFRATVREMGTVSMAVSMEDVPISADMADMTSEALIASGFVERLVSDTKLASGLIEFSDLGIVNRLIEFQALQDNKTADEVRQDILTQLSASRAEMAGSPLALEAVDALSAFVETPGTVSIHARPDEPVPFNQVLVATQINPALLLEMLNLRVTSSE